MLIGASLLRLAPIISAIVPQSYYSDTLLASPFIVLWPGETFDSISVTNIWQALPLFLVGIAILVGLLHLSQFVSFRLRLVVHNKMDSKGHTGAACRIFGVLYDRKAWYSLFLILLVMLSIMFLGIVTFTTALGLSVIVGASIANPFIYPQHAVRIGPLIINTPIESALLVIAGLGLALLVLHLSNLVVGVIGKGIIARFRGPVVNQM